MVKVIDSQVESQTVHVTHPIWRVILIGIIMGVIYWVLAKLFANYNLNLDTAGNIATIITATIGVIVLIGYHVEQPLIISVATAACLWGLADLTNGLVANEVLLWSLGLYGLSYAVFYWVTRYSKIAPVLIMTLIIVLAIRLIAVM